jgi:hypothetical protein
MQVLQTLDALIPIHEKTNEVKKTYCNLQMLIVNKKSN